MHLRSATPADAEAVLALWKTAGATPSVTDSADALRRIAGRPETAFLVAIADDTVVGSIIATFDGWRGNIYRLATHPDHRRRGVARALLTKAEEALAGWGARRITALVETEHPRAVGFWRAVGYLDDRRMSRYVRTLTSLLAVAVAALVLVAACSGAGKRDPRYPRRRPGCALAIYNGLPTGAWDDIGMVQVDCYLDESEVACLSRMRTEACRMGGDIIYNVPKKALRPVERGMLYRAQVAHTREAAKKDDAPAPTDAGSGPLVPLPKAADVAATPAPTDAGARTDGGAAPVAPAPAPAAKP